MKSTSAERVIAPTERVGTWEPAGDDGPRVRPARLGRQLSAVPLDPCYADARLEQLVLAATAEAQATAVAEGYAQGFAAGARAAATQARAETERCRREETERLEAFTVSATTALTALRTAVDSLRRATATTWTGVAEELLDGALRLARAVLDRELAAVDAEVAEAVRTALRTAADPHPQVLVHPEDLAVLAALPIGDLPDDVRFNPDPTVPRGGAVATTGYQHVLVHLPTALAAAEEVLRS
jgi:flagellar assembly protein FliH